MPLLKIQTNRQLSAEDCSDLLKNLSMTVAQALGKPERYVMIVLEENQSMLFAGSDDPMAFLELKSIGLPVQITGDLSATLCGTIGFSLDIPTDRIYIEFADAERAMWGWNSTTFANG